MASLTERADRLVESLLVNDREEVYNAKETPAKPAKAIDELARRKESAMPALIQLIERYEREKEGRYYIDYVAEILGRVGGNQSSALLLRILLAYSKAELDDGSDMTCIRWLRKLGKTAVPAIVGFVEKNYDQTFAVGDAAEAMEEIKDERLVPLLLKLLEYPNYLVVQSALLSLGRQNDMSVVTHIIPFLQYKDENLAEQRQTREDALLALESLLGDDQARLREIKSQFKSESRHAE